MSRRSSTTFFAFPLDDMKGGGLDDDSMEHGTVERQLRAPPLISEIFSIFSSTFSCLDFYFSTFSSFFFRPFHTAQLLLLEPFSDLNFLNCARDSISILKKTKRGHGKGVTTPGNMGTLEKFSPDHQGPGFLSKPFFDAPLPRIFA